MADEVKTTEKASYDPKGKSLAQRVVDFIADVKDKYGIILTKDAGRTAEWQQKHHVAHMFLYNKYQSTTPAKTDTGKRTILWKHFSDPKVNWDTIQRSDFLRTKDNSVPTVTGTEWTNGLEPDQAKTEANVKSLLISANIGNNGQAMVSPGLSPCGEPCKCGLGRSNHLNDSAADLGSTGIQEITQKLQKEKDKEKALTLDDYLKKFGLYRPLLDHPSSPEEWHIEAIADQNL